MVTNPAKIAARSEINHSGELKPIMPIPQYRSSPSCGKQITKNNKQNRALTNDIT